MDGGRDDEVAGWKYLHNDPLYNLKIIFTAPERCVTSHPGAAGLTCCHQDAALGIHDPLAQRLRGETCKLNMKKRKAERRSCCSTYSHTSYCHISIGCRLRNTATSVTHNTVCLQNRSNYSLYLMVKPKVGAQGCW